MTSFREAEVFPTRNIYIYIYSR